MMLERRVGTLLFVASALTACSDWTPIRTARDVEGQRVKIESAGKEVVIDEVVTCDDSGFVIASQPSDCREGEHTFDTRRDKVLVADKDTKSSVGYIVAGVLASIFVPAAIVGSAILSSR